MSHSNVFAVLPQIFAFCLTDWEAFPEAFCLLIKPFKAEIFRFEKEELGEDHQYSYSSVLLTMCIVPRSFQGLGA